MVDHGLDARLQRRLRELYTKGMQTHERRLAEWRRLQAARDSLHTEFINTVCT